MLKYGKCPIIGAITLGLQGLHDEGWRRCLWLHLRLYSLQDTKVVHAFPSCRYPNCTFGKTRRSMYYIYSMRKEALHICLLAQDLAFIFIILISSLFVKMSLETSLWVLFCLGVISLGRFHKCLALNSNKYLRARGIERHGR